MLRKLSLMTVKSMIPICAKSMTLHPKIPIYDYNRMGPMMLQKSLYSHELHSKSKKPICNETPVGINGMNSLAKLIIWNSFGEDGVNVTFFTFFLIVNYDNFTNIYYFTLTKR